MIWLLLSLLAVLAVGSFVLSERLRRPMNEVERKGAPGRFVTLSGGVTHLRWDGNVRGPVAVCIHGLTSSSYVWDDLASRLSLMGFRVLRYDLYGRGFSDRPGGAQDRTFFLSQLDELLESQGLTGDLTLFGYSMGGSIAACFAAAHPERVDRLVLLAPAGLGVTAGPLAEFARRTPVVGDWLMRIMGGWNIRRTTRASAADPEIAQQQINETRYRGFLPAVLSSQRHMLAEDLSTEHRAIATADIPVLAVWGDRDTAIPLSAVGRLAEQNRAARQEVIKGATHGLPHTHAAQIHHALQATLRDD